jgi:hypothetical protein
MKFIFPIFVLLLVLGAAIFLLMRDTPSPTLLPEEQPITSVNTSSSESTSSQSIGNTTVDTTTLSLRTRFGGEKTLSFQTQKGEVRVNNFYREAEFILEDGHATIKRVDDYTLTYVALLKSFQITITAPDILDTKNRAEKDLLNILGVSPQDLCKMNPVVFVDKGFDPRSEYTRSFPLSFCPTQ